MAFGLAVYASQSRSPDTTQDSLPVAGQALLGGVLTRKVPMKGFKVVFYISFPFPKLLGAPDASLLDSKHAAVGQTSVSSSSAIPKGKPGRPRKRN
jgi:hypothetical protein